MIRIKRELGIGADGLQNLLSEVTQAGSVASMPDADETFVLALLLWMARMAGGERLGFEDACDIPVRTIEIEMTEEEQAAAAAEAQRRKEIEAQPGVRPTEAATQAAE
ncbi:hypothetical protein [Frankia sp. Cj3]|uniref:hypothetical protein n=1 Tax=Frankia sp. Cj3 TaxID=2880976 RepID=UPI001EF62621|nr:hypothetical protein [Frankia sp. Cj3]